MMSKKSKVPAEPFVLEITDLTHEGAGVGRRDGKAVFVNGALPGEIVRCIYSTRRARYDVAHPVEVLHAAAQRVEPRCAHFAICGGCAMQHVQPAEQLALKQRWLLESLRHIGKVEPVQVLEALTGPLWGYRRRARLGVKWVAKKGRVLVGFREKNSAYIADLQRCEVLDERIGGRLSALAALVQQLSIRERLPQIEVAGGDSVLGLNFRVLSEPSAADLQLFHAFAAEHDCAIYLQSGAEDSVQALSAAPTLSYALPAAQLDLQFQPWHFIQVNAAMNRKLVARVVELLQLNPQTRVLDLFCGLGNFTLALARCAREVVGVEGAASLVEWARHNATVNGINNARFHAADLSRDLLGQPWLQGSYERILLDPPRSGALEVLPQLAQLGAQRLVYVSCHPATLARDVGILVQQYGYRLESAGVLDMFPHTAHVESLALLVRG